MVRLFCCLFLLITSLSSVNAKGIKYGKITKEEALLKECSFEKNAHAILLNKSCVVSVDFNKIRYTHHVRLKILDEKALDQSDIELLYYSKNKLEAISSIKAQTINFDEKGKKVVSSLSSKSIFKTDINENYSAVRFTLPNVKVGSIIEYKYTLSSSIYSYLDTWYFQSDIPTVRSYIKVNIPEYFNYDLIMFGDRIKSKYVGKGGNEWELNYLSSIKEEPYINNYYDFIDQIRFQLVGYYKRNELGTPEFVTVNKSWDKVAREYVSEISPYIRKGFAKKLLTSILKGDETPWIKIQKIHHYVTSRIVWNGKYGIYPKVNMSELVKTGVGNKANINMLYATLLNAAGIESYLSLSKTNTSGLLQKQFPLMSQFNNPIVYVKIYNKKFFTDATSAYRSYELLAEKDLNYFAFVLDKKRYRWEKIKPFESNLQGINTTYDFSNLKKPILKCNIFEDGYFAEKTRKKLNDIKQDQSILNRYLNLDDDVLIKDSIQIKNRNDINKKINISINQNIDNLLSFDDDIIYFSPFTEGTRKNPFLSEERHYRVDFNYPFTKTHNIKIIIPDTYVFDKSLNNKIFKLPQNYGLFNCKQIINKNELIIRIVFKINVPSISKNYYGALRQFYTLMSETLNQQLIIKRK